MKRIRDALAVVFVLLLASAAVDAWQQGIQDQIDAIRSQAEQRAAWSAVASIEYLVIAADADALMVGVSGDDEAANFHELCTEAVAEAERHQQRCRAIIEADAPGQQGVLARLVRAENFLPNIAAANRELRAATMYAGFAEREFAHGEETAIEADSWLLALDMHLQGM